MILLFEISFTRLFFRVGLHLTCNLPTWFCLICPKKGFPILSMGVKSGCMSPFLPMQKFLVMIPLLPGSQQCICWLSPEWHLGHWSHEHDRTSGMTQKLSSLLGWVQQEHTISIWCLQRWNKTMHCITSWKWTFLRELAVSCGLQKDAKYFILYNSIHTYIAIYLHNNRENHKNKKSFNVCFLDVLLLSVIYYCTNTECIWGTTASKGLDWWIETLFSFQALGIFVRILRPSILLH